MFRKLRTTQKHRHQAADGHVRHSPTGHDPHRSDPAGLTHAPSATHKPADWGPRAERREVIRQSNITVDRRRNKPHKLAKRNTKFITNFSGQVKIPRNTVGGEGMIVGGGVKRIDVGQVPED
jgi:hypothetical protein